ncbi:OmpA family protein [Fontivita pretiosa]|uniref:OmpA/MotB family protein n=1 Tax=Fontivita pretiosa TaxID=2989684 RepID=UPI003D172DA2
MLHVAVAGLILTALSGVSGCVSQEKYNALKLDRDALAEQLGKAQNDASTARAEADSYKQQLAALMGQGGNLNALVTNLQQQNANLQAELDALNRKYADAIARAGSGTALPQPLTNELTAFAQANPDLVDFDPARGIVKFKSDVTFALGEATLQPKAREVIQRFATILNSPAAANYELLVAGHTDNTRVSNPRTIQAGHKDNWYLSAHRAITVAQELMSHNVNPQRIGVVGYADQRPIASNASESGKAQNRRVEVLILPTTIRGGSNFASGSGKPAKPLLNKDTTGGTATVNTNPALNK